MKKLKKKYLLFDLDGTITESGDGIVNCVQYALNTLGTDEQDREKLKQFIGPPLRESFPEYYGFNRDDTERAVALYRERYERIGIFECDIYEGIAALIRDCFEAGYVVVLATSKPRIYAHKILKHFNIYEYFTHVVGCELDGRLDTKAEVIECAITLCGDEDRSDYIMIGDRFYDIDGAKALGIESIGVLYGYGSEDELKNAGADYTAANISELRRILLNMR